MVLLLGALLLGFFVARLQLLPAAVTKFLPRLGTVALLVLLFSMGVALGANSDLISSLANLGLHAVVLSLGTIVGSVAMVWFAFGSKGKKT